MKQLHPKPHLGGESREAAAGRMTNEGQVVIGEGGRGLHGSAA